MQCLLYILFQPKVSFLSSRFIYSVDYLISQSGYFTGISSQDIEYAIFHN